MKEPNQTRSKLPRGSGSRVIRRVLPMAVRLWLRTQVEYLEGLVFQLNSTDRQILSGYIPEVAVAAQRAVYQGIYLSQIELSAEEVRINLRQVLRGQPLRLLQSFSVFGEVKLTEQDLNASLQSDLLSGGIRKFWHKLLSMPTVDHEVRECYGLSVQDMQLSEYVSEVRIGENSLTLSLSASDHLQTQAPETGFDHRPSTNKPVILRSEIDMESGRLLKLRQPQWLSRVESEDGYLSQALADFQWDLGSQTRLNTLVVESGILRCQGGIVVKP